MRYVCHVGVHKTGTSLLQENLKKNVGRLRQKGIFYVNVEDRETIKAQMWMIRKIGQTQRLPGLGVLAETNEKMRKKAAAAGAHTILLSHEDRIGYAPYANFRFGRQTTRFYEHAGPCLRRIFHGFAEDEQCVLLYSRRQSTLIPSLYSEGLRNLACPFGLEEFFDRCEKQTFQFSDLVRRIVEKNPQADLRMRRFETIKLDVRAFIQNFLTDVGIDPFGLDLVTETVRPSFDQAQAEELVTLSQRRLSNQIDAKDAQMQLRAIASRSPDRANPIRVSEHVLSGCRALEATDQFEWPIGETERP